MLTSSLFHTFLCHSAAAKAAWQRADHAAILLALWGTYIRIIVTNFSCWPTWLVAHLAAVSLLCWLVLRLERCTGSGGGNGSGGKRSRTVVLPLFLALALYAVAPFAHWIVITSSLAHSNVTLQATSKS
jgi:predicted membrane channel-forming protein YqfA (hemolysin III family)